MCPARIKLDRCDILTVKADVCVCAVHRSRDMKVYPLSKQVLRKGGQAVQNELYEAGSKNSEELEMGQVEMTDAGKLPNFKKVMFINLRSYIDGNEKYLQQSLQECLELAATLRYTSIAVPALGTGGLNYPPEKVASATVDAVALHNLQFKDKSSVESVNIVLLDSDIELIKTYLRVCVTGSVNLSDEEEDDETGASGGVREGQGQPAGNNNQSNESQEESNPQRSSSRSQNTDKISDEKPSNFSSFVINVMSFFKPGFTFSYGILQFTVRPSLRGLHFGVTISFFPSLIPHSLKKYWEALRKTHRQRFQ